MATKDITDEQVIKAYLKSKAMQGVRKYPYHILQEETGECEKVCYKACERAERRGYIDYGVSLRSGWVTDKGIDLIK